MFADGGARFYWASSAHMPVSCTGFEARNCVFSEALWPVEPIISNVGGRLHDNDGMWMAVGLVEEYRR